MYGPSTTNPFVVIPGLGPWGGGGGGENRKLVGYNHKLIGNMGAYTPTLLYSTSYTVHLQLAHHVTFPTGA